MEVPASRRVIVFNKASILSMYVCTGQFSAHIHLNMKGNSLSQSLGKLFRSSVYKLLPSMNSLGNTVKYLEIKYMKDSPASLHLRGGGLTTSHGYQGSPPQLDSTRQKTP